MPPQSVCAMKGVRHGAARRTAPCSGTSGGRCLPGAKIGVPGADSAGIEQPCCASWRGRSPGSTARRDADAADGRAVSNGTSNSVPGRGLSIGMSARSCVPEEAIRALFYSAREQYHARLAYRIGRGWRDSCGWPLRVACETCPAAGRLRACCSNGDSRRRRHRRHHPPRPALAGGRCTDRMRGTSARGGGAPRPGAPGVASGSSLRPAQQWTRDVGIQLTDEAPEEQGEPQSSRRVNPLSSLPAARRSPHEVPDELQPPP